MDYRGPPGPPRSQEKRRRRAEHEEKREGFHRIERSYGSFSRSLTVPKGIDPSAVTAAFEKGVLEVRIPKPEERKPHRV